MNKSFSLQEIANIINGKIIGDKNIKISGVNSLKIASANDISLLYKDAYLNQLKNSKAGAIITNKKYSPKIKNGIICKNPRLELIKVLKLFENNSWSNKITNLCQIGINTKLGIDITIDPNVNIGENCIVGDRVKIGSGVSIGNNCKIDNDTIIYPNVVIYHGCKVGRNVIIHANTTIGTDGFGFETVKGIHEKIPHIKAVNIKDNVEIGSNCVIDRGSLIDTTIGEGTKFDNFIHIAHNCQIGRYNLFCACASLGGSVITGDYVILGGQSIIIDSAILADYTILSGGSKLMRKHTKTRSELFGYPAVDKKKWFQSLKMINRIPLLINKINKLEKLINKNN